MEMAQSSNGKHRRIAIESLPDRAAGSQVAQAAERAEVAITEMHEIVLAKSSAFIREHPGASLLLAATVGGVLGWLIKRRG